MANWQRKLLLNPEWDLAQENKISTQELAASIAKKMRALIPFKAELEHLNDEREEIAEQFADLAADENATQRDFNYLFEDLYNWGDLTIEGDWSGKKVCWIDTMTHVEAA